MKRFFTIICMMSMILFFLGCDDGSKKIKDSETGNSDSDVPDSQDDGDVVAVDDEPAANDSDQPSDPDHKPDVPENPNATNKALVFEFNPARNPEPIEVELKWVAEHDDPELGVKGRGYLTAAADDEGIRKVKAYNCPDLKESVKLPGSLIGMPGEYDVPLCSPIQMANKNLNGNYIYEDLTKTDSLDDYLLFDTEKMTFQKIDRSAEVTMYYHTTKVYSYLTGLGVPGFSKLGGHIDKQNGDKKVPLSVVANFQMPDFQALFTGGHKLNPMDNAFFTPANPMMSMVLGEFGIEGEMLVFGQGTKGDFAYDGDVVYHEFGHATANTTAELAMGAFPDLYGLSNEPAGIHEGIADTVSFIMSGDPCLGEYISGAIGYSKGDDGFACMRHAENTMLVNENFTGESHHDGLPLVAANWALYQLAKEKKIGADENEQRDNFTKLIIKSLLSFNGDDRGQHYKVFAEILLDEVKNDDKFSPYVEDIKKIYEERHFFDPIRARRIEQGKSIQWIFSGGASATQDMTGGGTGMKLEDDTLVAPAYLQVYFDVPEDFEKEAVLVKANQVAQSGGIIPGMGGGSPEFKLYVREESPIEYEMNEDGKFEVSKDVLAENDASGSRGEWSFNVEPGKRYYFQFVNYSQTGGYAGNITVEGTAGGADPDDDSDDDNSDDSSDEETPDSDSADPVTDGDSL